MCFFVDSRKSVAIYLCMYVTELYNYWRVARHEKVKPKTWRISASSDTTWLQVFTTDQPRCYAFETVLRPLVFTKKLWLSCFRDKIFEKIFFFSLVDAETCKNSKKMFLLTGTTICKLPLTVHSKQRFKKL